MTMQEEIVQGWRDLKVLLLQALDLYRSGALRTHTNKDVDDTAQSIADCERQIAEFDRLIERYSPKLTSAPIKGTSPENRRW
jgi:hypothetical protein